jgi:hypothetical protein
LFYFGKEGVRGRTPGRKRREQCYLFLKGRRLGRRRREQCNLLLKGRRFK